MTPEQLQAIKDRADKATVGPWRLDLWDGLLISEVTKGVVLKAGQGRVVKGASEDIKFIAHAREDIPALVAEVELQKANAEQYLRDNVELHNENLILNNELQRLNTALDCTELAEVKARMEIEDLGEYFNALLGQRIRHLEKLRAENDRLRAALEFYADEKHYEPYNFNCYGCDVTEDEGIIARTALAGDSDAI